MGGFIDIALSFPTVVYSLFFTVVAVYWLFVLVGALDIDIIDIGGDADGLLDGAAEGVAEGVAEGAAEGIAEGVAEGAAEGVAEGPAEGAAEGVAEGASEGGVAGVLTALRLRSAPVTVTGSVLVAWSWLFTYLGADLFNRLLGDAIPRWAWGTVLMLGAFVAALPLTSMCVRPLGKLFITHAAPGRDAILGKLCEIRTGRVDHRFGQAECADGGAGQLIEVRCDVDNKLKKGDEALVIDYDAERQAFVIEPMSRLLAEPEDDQDEDAIAEALAEA